MGRPTATGNPIVPHRFHACPAEAQEHRFEADPIVVVRENFVACDVLSQLQRVMDNPRFLSRRSGIARFWPSDPFAAVPNVMTQASSLLVIFSLMSKRSSPAFLAPATSSRRGTRASFVH